MEDDTLQNTFWLMVFLQTIGSVDMPGSGPRKMPSPRSYVAIVILWETLQLLANAGNGKPARYAAWLLVTAGVVLGPFGKKAVSFMNTTAQLYSNPFVGAATAGVAATGSGVAAVGNAPGTAAGNVTAGIVSATS